MRTEKDFLGEIELNDNIYYGISTYRSLDNFDVSYEFVDLRIVYELVNIKKQAAIANMKLKSLDKVIGEAIVKACNMILNHEFDSSFVVNKYQGGAGTSTNMNVNEVIANISLEILGKKLGEYDYIHPINHVNLHQSTNDAFPTAVKISCIKEIRNLANSYASLQKAFQVKESEYGSVLKLARTEYMDALPILAGQMFGAYSETVSRDRWRIYKVEERLRTINIGGTAIGTGLNAPLKYTFMMTTLLQDSTNIGLSRAESLIDNTQNLDSFNEVSSLLKVAASTLIKISNDLRFLSSGPHGGIGEIVLHDNQVGSSIMPGKVNPVILEMVIQNANKVITNDMLITNLVSSGSLELNPFVPMIGETLLESLTLLSKTVDKFNEKCIKTLSVNKERCLENLEKSASLITPLISIIGYDRASEIVKIAQSKKIGIKEVLVKEKLFTKEDIDDLLEPYNITKPGVIKGGS
ncbi:MAG: Aspartate ammonia-lyase [Candidatus Izimaplasma bacterium HR2]|nr:MAG: Aspartate ammonia-lyase [Candidatus Izimaplasma bacterium HR2]